MPAELSRQVASAVRERAGILLARGYVRKQRRRYLVAGSPPTGQQRENDW